MGKVTKVRGQIWKDMEMNVIEKKKDKPDGEMSLVFFFFKYGKCLVSYLREVEESPTRRR